MKYGSSAALIAGVAIVALVINRNNNSSPSAKNSNTVKLTSGAAVDDGVITPDTTVIDSSVTSTVLNTPLTEISQAAVDGDRAYIVVFAGALADDEIVVIHRGEIGDDVGASFNAGAGTMTASAFFANYDLDTEEGSTSLLQFGLRRGGNIIHLSTPVQTTYKAVVATPLAITPLAISGDQASAFPLVFLVSPSPAVTDVVATNADANATGVAPTITVVGPNTLYSYPTAILAAGTRSYMRQLKISSQYGQVLAEATFFQQVTTT